MSNHVHVYLACDKCGIQSEGLADATAREARSQAKAQDWKLGKQKDYCPACKADIQAKINEILSGTL